MAEHRGDRPEREIVRSRGGVARGGADVRSDELRRHHHAGPALDGLPFQGIVAVRGPDPVGAFQDAEIHAGAPGGATFNLDAGVGLAELVEEPVDGLCLGVHGRAAGVAHFGQVPVLVPFEVTDPVFAQQGIEPVEDVLPGRRIDQVKDLLVPPLHGQPASQPAGRAARGTLGRAGDPVRVGAGQVGVLVDHFGFDPEPEFHAVAGDRVDQRREARRATGPRRRTSRRGPRGRRGGRGTSRRRGRSVPRRARRPLRRVRAGVRVGGRSTPLPRR